MLKKHMQVGDSRAAMVLLLDPLMVAAYADELDCVALLEFPSWLVEDYSLKVGSRLLTVNTYGRRAKFAADLVEGPESYGNWNHFFPVIAEFTCDGMDQIDRRKRQIPDAEWKRAAQMAKLKLLQSCQHTARWPTAAECETGLILPDVASEPLNELRRAT